MILLWQHNEGNGMEMGAITIAASETFAESLAGACDQRGRSLAEISRSAFVLLIFLRHLG